MESLEYNLSNTHLLKGWRKHNRCGEEHLATCQRIYRIMFKLLLDLMHTTASQRGHQPLSPEIRRGYESGVRKYWSCWQIPPHRPPRAQSWDNGLRNEMFPMLSFQERFPAQRYQGTDFSQNSCPLGWSKVSLWNVAEHWDPGQTFSEPVNGIQLSPCKLFPLLIIYCN